MKKYTVLLVGLALMLPVAAGAAQFRSGDTVGFNETMRENVYAVGGVLNIAGTVEGDLYVAGGNVNIIGTVTKDVVVVGGTVIITGKVGEDLRIGGGNVTVGGTIGGELVVAGGSMNILPGTMIAGSAYLGSGNINMNGSVGNNLVVASGAIALGSGLKVAGNFDYYSQKEITIDASSVKISGATTFHQQEIRNQGFRNRAPFFAFLTIWGLLGLAGAVVLACLLFYLWKQESKEMIEAAFASPGRELLRGFIVLIVLPIAAIVCLITVVGLPLGFLIGAGYGALLILGAAATGLLWAALIARYIFKRKETDINWWLIIIAVIVLALIKIIPFVGWLIGFLVFLVGLGVLSNMLYKKLAPKS